MKSETFKQNSCYAKMTMPDIVELRENKLRELAGCLINFKTHLTSQLSNENTDKNEVLHIDDAFKDIQNKWRQLISFKSKLMKIKNKLFCNVQLLENGIETQCLQETNQDTDYVMHQSDLYLM